jgi:hypothetical protein
MFCFELHTNLGLGPNERAIPLARGSGRLAGVCTHPAGYPCRGVPPAVLRDSSTYFLKRQVCDGRRRLGVLCGGDLARPGRHGLAHDHAAAASLLRAVRRCPSLDERGLGLGLGLGLG